MSGRKDNMKITFCGGAGEVGASCFLVETDGKNILLDCGIRMSGGKDSLPDFRMIQEAGGVDAIFISHAHLDHTGSLPIISREYPEAIIYMTHATKDLVRVLLYDSLKIMERQEAEIPIYAEKHVIDMLGRIVCFSPEHTIEPFADEDIKATFYASGHILGAAGIYIQSKGGNIFYSGDISMTNQYTVNGAAIPKLRPDIMLVESTYGDKLHSNRQLEEKRLIDMVDKVISRGGKILIPAFALGRAQEVILILKRAKNRGELKRLKVYVDGMVKDICRVYRLNPNYLRPNLARRVLRGQDVFFDEHIIQVENRDMREKIIEDDEPCCIISSSGMLSGGPSQWYASKLMADEKNHIAITGYQDEEAPGRLLLNLLASEGIDEDERQVIQFGDIRVTVRASIGRYSLSAHGDKGEILGLCHALSPRELFLVHGEEEATMNLAREIQKEIWGEVYVAENGQIHSLDIKNPRKQIKRRRISSLQREGEPQEEDIKFLWDHIVNEGGENFIFSSEDILKIWNDNIDLNDENVRSVMNILTNSKYFTPDRRRPFLFRLATQYDLEEEEGPMEVNQMLRMIDEFFPPQTGLYKKGARFEQGIALLHFNFPQRAAKIYTERFKDFEEHTGWKVEINEECNLVALENVIYNLLPKGCTIKGKISFYREEGAVNVAIKRLTKDDKTRIEFEFGEITGLDLIIDDGLPTKQVKAPSAKEGQMEQNRAFAIIDRAFSSTEHRLYRRGLKSEGQESFIELSFITSQIGEHYKDVIRDIENETGWEIRINPNPNQNELVKLARRVLERNGLFVNRNPSIYPGERRVKLSPSDEWERAAFECAGDEFYQSTGYIFTV